MASPHFPLWVNPLSLLMLTDQLFSLKTLRLWNPLVMHPIPKQLLLPKLNLLPKLYLLPLQLMLRFPHFHLKLYVKQQQVVEVQAQAKKEGHILYRRQIF